MARRFGLLASAVLLVVLNAGCQSFKVEPGQVGILVNYQNGEMTEIKPGTFQWNNDPYKHLIIYPTTQQTMTMVQAVKEGKIVGDDSVPCRDKGNYQVSWDVAVYWRVNPEHAKDLYLLKREMPLTGPGEDDIESQVVRSAARSKIREVCPGFEYQAMEPARPEIAKSYEERLKADLASSFIIVDKIELRDLHLDPKLQDAVNTYIAGQQQLSQAEFARQKAVKEAETAAVNYKLEQDRLTYANTADNERKIAQAKADAAVLLARMNSEAEGNERLARSITPALSEYVRSQHWDGKLPNTMLGANSTTMLQVP